MPILFFGHIAAMLCCWCLMTSGSVPRRGWGVFQVDYYRSIHITTTSTKKKGKTWFVEILQWFPTYYVSDSSDLMVSCVAISTRCPSACWSSRKSAWFVLGCTFHVGLSQPMWGRLWIQGGCSHTTTDDLNRAGECPIALHLTWTNLWGTDQRSHWWKM
jgi:hypothetical protein